MNWKYEILTSEEETDNKNDQFLSTLPEDLNHLETIEFLDKNIPLSILIETYLK